jgi:hypothetical protein
MVFRHPCRLSVRLRLRMKFLGTVARVSRLPLNIAIFW